ncbi:hypothetical protein [Oligoflexus tunisiensis]|uniref:hypothetical protein n=1 Tax=Oligoflexus tunisiensis TaxID=708132 RepID=UPI00114C8DE6|nr:hypothetical protein [Oligoflexus tunisiensis]
MGRHLTSSGLILPVIRKVICRDDFFVCSICRSEYKSKVEANNCLNHCWFDVQQLYPVVLRKLNGRHVVFRCHFCCRDYKDESEALSCARRCQGDRNQLHVHEQLLNDLPIEAPTHRPSRIRLVAMKTMPVRPAKSKAPEEDPVEQVDDVQEDVESPLEADAPVSQQRTKADFPKPWVRMDAKYQCCYCKKLFYTKMETETCFNGHFDEEGYEKPNA